MGMMSQHMSLPLLRTDVDGLFMQAPTVLVRAYVRFLILLFHTVSILQGLWNTVSSCYKTKQILGEKIMKCVLKWAVCGWQGVWEDLGRFLGWLSHPITQDLTPE